MYLKENIINLRIYKIFKIKQWGLLTMKQQDYLTEEQYEKAKLEAVQEVPKILKHTVAHTINGLPESLGFKAAYDDIMTDPGDNMWNMAQMYEFGRIAGIKVERERKRKVQRREELKLKYPEMAAATNGASDLAIEMVGILETLTSEERKIFIKYFENKF